MAIMRVVGLLGLLALAGCASAPRHLPPPVEDAREAPSAAPIEPSTDAPVEGSMPSTSGAKPTTTPPAARPAEMDQRAAVARVLARAEQQLAQGQYSAAIDTAERGLRLDRYAADLYRVLAQAYAGMGGLEQARNFARLGLRYVGSNTALRNQLELLAR